MFYVSRTYTLIALAIVPALFLMTFTYTRSIKAATKQASKATGQVSDVATEDINALTVIKVFTREEGRRRLEPLLDGVIGEAMAMDFTREELHELFQKKLSQWKQDGGQS